MTRCVETAVKYRARVWLRRLVRAAALTASLVASGPPSHAQQVLLDGTVTAIRDDFSDVAIDDPAAMFKAVFAVLPQAVDVAPTENYLFVSFYHSGRRYDANLRLDAADRDRGVIHFAYYERRPAPFNPGQLDPGQARHHAFGADDGVTVKRVDDFTYVVIVARHAVVFRLNRLKDAVPEPRHIGENEVLIGPIEDESGTGFFLVWMPDHRLFAYVLDEGRQGDRLDRPAFSHQLAIGRRTGFAYYRDRYRERWLLAAVPDDEARRNTMFDGPFDQMPDNFIEGDILREALLAYDQSLEGRIDRFGNFEGLTGRAIIVPYKHYRSADELALFDQCAARAGDAGDFYRCFDQAKP